MGAAGAGTSLPLPAAALEKEEKRRLRDRFWFFSLPEAVGGRPQPEPPSPSLSGCSHAPRRIYFARILKRKKEKESKASATSFLAEEAAMDNVDDFVFLASLHEAQRTGVQYGKCPGSEEGSPARGRSAVR